ncbi:right-handed parallel beta-helix repeat-containing protein, partial [Candidatus Pacearchaeota archaeon]|nr:right-handed parallel beta-helix repeat-containing protein [Candidatus Pacearchaeota archaeon]
VLSGWIQCESQIVCGGNANWQNIYYADLSSLPVYLNNAPAIYLNAYQNNIRISPAQEPESFSSYPLTLEGLYSVPVLEVTRTSLTDSRLANFGGSDLIGKYIYLWHNPNVVTTRKILDYDSGTNTITFADTNVYTDRNTLYSIANSMNSNILNRAGEYYLDETAGVNGYRLFLWPLNDQNLVNSGEVVISNSSFGINIGTRSYITIEGFTLRNFAGDSYGEGAAIYRASGGYSNGVIIKKNEIYNLYMSDFAAIHLPNINHIDVDGNYLHDIKGMVIRVLSSTNLSVINNIIRRNSGTSIYTPGDINGRIINNTLIDNIGVHANGITVYQGARDMLIADNIVVGSNNPLTLQSSSNITIYNNLLDGLDVASLVLTDWGDMSGSIHILNNLLIGSNTNNSLRISNSIINDTFVMNNILDGSSNFPNRDNNIYIGRSGFQTSRDTDMYRWTPFDSEIVADGASTDGWGVFWDLHYPYEVVEQGSEGVYQLSSSSLAIDTGADISDIIAELQLKWLGYDFYEDMEGNPRPQNGAWDIGPYEYQGGVVVPPTLTNNNITQFGITWTFDRPLTSDGSGDSYQTGTFANGDHWVVNPDGGDGEVVIIGISPESVVGDGITTSDDPQGVWVPQLERTVHGSMINPDPTVTAHGYDNYPDRSIFDQNLNEARPNGQDLSISNNLSITPGSSLVSSISLDHANDEISKTKLYTAAVLTVLDVAPLENSFRPPYAGANKGVKFNEGDIDYTKLQNLPITPAIQSELFGFNGGYYRRWGDYRDVDSFEDVLNATQRNFQRVWIDHYPDDVGDEIHPYENYDDYGFLNSLTLGFAGLVLNLDFTDDEKKDSVVNLIQLGIDLYGVYEAGGNRLWVANGGHGNGRKLPILFSGVMLSSNPDAQVMKDIGFNEPDDPWFSEDGQAFYVDQAEIDATNSWICGGSRHPDGRDCGLGGASDCPPEASCANWIPYEQQDIGLPEWGIRNEHPDSYKDRSNKWWDTMYRYHQASTPFPGTALTLHIMNITNLWNHNSFLDYSDRYYEINSQEGWYMPLDFIQEMWGEYREDYDCKWIRDDASFSIDLTNLNDPVYSQGHYDCNGEDFRCDWAGSTMGIEVSSCASYGSNERALDYDPCGVGGVDGCSGVVPPVTNEYSVSVDGQGTDFDLAGAIAYANANTDEEITFLLEDGDYGNYDFNIPLIRTAWVTYRAVNGETPIFSIVDSDSLRISSQSYTRYDGITIKSTGGYAEYKNMVRISDSNNIELLNMDFIGDGYEISDHRSAVYLENSNYITFDGCHIYGETDIGELDGFGYGIQANGDSPSNYINIENCEIEETGKAIVTHGNYWNIDNNHLHDIEADGIIITNSNHSILNNNTVHDLYRATGSSEHADCIQVNYLSGSLGSPTYSENITIKNNLCYD